MSPRNRIRSATHPRAGPRRGISGVVLLISLTLLVCFARAASIPLSEGVDGFDPAIPHQHGRLRPGRRASGDGAYYGGEPGLVRPAVLGAPVANGKALETFPSVEESTVLFLHVFKVRVSVVPY